MDNNQWEPKRRIELQLQRSLSKLGEEIYQSVKELDDPFEVDRIVRSWLSNMRFNYWAERIAKNLVSEILNTSKGKWRMAARETTTGRSIYEALRNELQGPVGASVASQINRNAEIIKSMPLDISRQITKYIGEESVKGVRASKIAENLLFKFPVITEKKAALIARTETSKTSTALTQARCEMIGAGWYRWRTSEDIRVRDSHRHMRGVLIKWSNPPSPERLIGAKNPPAPYHAGNIYNCRCYPEPVISLSYIQWPTKVYYAGSIMMMTRAQFEKIA